MNFFWGGIVFIVMLCIFFLGHYVVHLLFLGHVATYVFFYEVDILKIMG
jgi:hypothetical protein